MKKSLLTLILVSCLAFFGWNKANAAVVTIATNNTNALAANAALPTQLNAVLYSFSIANGTGAAIAANSTYTFSSGVSNINVSTPTISLYRYTSATFPGTGTATLCGTLTTSAINTGIVITNTKTIPTGTTYYFLVENFAQPNSAGSFTFSLTAIGGGITTGSTLPIAGNAYAWTAATTVTLNSFNTAGANGLAYNPLYSSETVVPVYGFSLTPGATGNTALFPQIVLHIAAGTIYNSTLTTLTLWSSPTSSFDPTTATNLATYNSSSGDVYGTFNLGTPISIAAGAAATYYFVTENQNYPGQPNSEFDYYSACGTITPGATTTGYNYLNYAYAAANPTITATNNTAGLSPAAGSTIYNPTTNVAAASMQLKTSASTVVLTKMVFTVSPSIATYSSYFSTPRLYSSSSATFSTGTATQITTAVPTSTGTTISFAIPNSTSAASTALIGTSGLYFFLVFDYTGAGATPQPFTFAATTYATCLSSAAVSPSYAANSYTCGTPGPYVLTLSSLTSTAGNNGLSATPVPYGSTNYSVYGFSLTGSGTVAGTTTISSLTFNQNGSTPDPNSSYYTTAYLYSSASSTYVPGTTNVPGNLVATTAASSSASSITFTPGTAISANNSTNTYYFIVFSNTLGDGNASTYQLKYGASSSTGTAITPYATAPGITGPAYTFVAAPTSVTLTSFNTAGANGLAYNPLYSGNTVVPIYGFSLVGGATGGNASISSITLHEATGTIYNTIISKLTLWTCPTSTYDPATALSVATYTSSTGDVNALFTPATAISVAAGSTSYYFVTEDQTYVGQAATELDYALSTGSPITAGTQTTGFYYTDYSSGSYTVTATNNTAGLNPAPGSNIYQTNTNLAVASMQLKTNASTVVLTKMTFTVSPSNATYNNYFSTPKLYSSTSATFNISTANQVSTAVVTYPTTTTILFTIPNSVAAASVATVGTGGLYFFLVFDYTLAGATPQTFTFAATSYTTTLSSTTASPAFAANTYYCQNGAFNATITSLTTTPGSNGLSATPIPISSTNYSVYGFSLAGGGVVAGSTTINSLTFIQNGTSTNADNTYYTTANLYSSTTNTYVPGTTNVPGNLVSSVASDGTSTITFPTSIAVTNSTSMYYFIVLTDDLGNYTTNTFKLSYSSAATSGTAITAGATVAGPAYTFQGPSLIAANIPAADLTNSAIYVGQKKIVLSGVSLATNTGTTPLTQIAFSYSVTAANLAKYFSGASVHLVVSHLAPTAPFSASDTTAVPISGVTSTGGTVVFTITGTTVNTTTAYYYLVANYTVTGGATPFTIKFGVSGYTTTLSGAVTTTTTSYPLNTFTCTTPTYYWTGTVGDNNWQTPGNWEVTKVAPIIVNGYYPGQIYAGNASSTLDMVDIAAAAGTYTINLNANITVATTTFESGVTTNLNIGTGFTLNDDYFTQGNTTSGSAASIVNLAGGGTYAVPATGSTDPTINYNSTFNVNTGGNLAIGTASIFSIFEIDGTTGNVAKLNLAGGAITANNSDFYFGGANATLTASSGTLTATNGTYLHLLSANNTVINNGATLSFDASGEINTDYSTDIITNNSGTFNITGGSVGSETGIINVNGGIFNVTASSLSLDGSSSAFNVNGGVTNITAASTMTANFGVYTNAAAGTTNIDNSTLALAVGGTSVVNSGTFNTTNNTAVNWTYRQSVLNNTGGSFNATNTTFNMSTNASALNVSAGAFNLNTGSIVNMPNSKDAITNSGTGTFTCAPSSVLNLTFSTATLANAATVTNSSVNAFTFLSDATGSATIGKIATIGTVGSFVGSFNVQRYISTVSRNYRLLSSPVNKTQALPGTAASPNVVDISALGQSVTSPATFNGAFIGGPGAGFTNYVANPIMYLYQESILPGSTENSTFTSGKNVGISNITSASPWTVTTVSTAAGGTTASDNSSTVKIPAGNAYLLYYIHDNTSSSVSTPLTTATTTASGYINQGTIPFVLWGSGTLTTNMTLTTGTGALYPGVTMVGNPYASTIDLQQLYKDNIVSGASVFTSGTGEPFYELDPSSEQFVSYNYNGTTATTSGSTASRYIASGQGFYVTVINNGKPMNFAEDQKVPSTTSAVVLANQPGTVLEGVRTGPAVTADNLISKGSGTGDLLTRSIFSGSDSLKLKKDPIEHRVETKVFHNPKPDTTTVPVEPVSTISGLHLKLVKDSLNFDEAGLYFVKDGLDKMNKADSKDLDGTGGKVFLSSYTTDRVRTSINTMGGYANGKRVPLFVKFSTSGLYQLQLEDIANINTNAYSVFLIDNMKNDSLDLTLYKSYNFNYAAGTANDSTRFVLVIEHKPVPHYALTAFAGQKVTAGVQLSWSVKNENNTTKFVLQKLTAGNTYTFLDSLSSDSSGTYDYIDQHPVMGNNTYRLQQTDGLGNITYSAPVTIGYNSTSPNGGLVLFPNPTKTTMTVTLNTSSINTQVATMDIYDIHGIRVEHKSVNSNSFVYDASAYKLGVYIVELKNSNGFLVGKSKFVKVQ